MWMSSGASDRLLSPSGRALVWSERVRRWVCPLTRAERSDRRRRDYRVLSRARWALVALVSLSLLSGCGSSNDASVLSAARAAKAAGCTGTTAPRRCGSLYQKACEAPATTEGREHLHAEFCEIAILTADGSKRRLTEARERWNEAVTTQAAAEQHPEEEIVIEEAPDIRRRPNWFKMDLLRMDARG